uniref:Uncharacterized protein n=1 Tax=Chlamydomonas euryale TaxID=1486919 RepID=A0A7R9V7G1_9CHLO|mmetsp:Transcript_22516/g.67042  ORF Transcript_22516/g.67042 Transcript_22516/m.67042 type:complete len:540 (+) Transcript_22516:507-2126(+)
MAYEEPDFDDVVPRDGRVNVPSTWRHYVAPTTQSFMQTDPVKTMNAKIQTTKRDSKAVQTGKDEEQVKQSVNAVGLEGFMASVLEMVQDEMKQVEEEHEILEPLTRVVDGVQVPADCLHELMPFGTDTLARGKSSAAAAHKKLVVTCLSWSCTGQSVAASYGRHDIPGWCEDRGVLATWNLGRDTINPTKADVNIDVDNCLMSCAFHPEHPALIAGGTFNGDLYVWDLSQEGDMQRAKSDALTDLRHREPLVSIKWQYSMSEHKKYGDKTRAYRLVTLGADGLVMVWKWHKLSVAIYGYRLLWPQPGTSTKIVYGGTCMDFQVDATQSAVGGLSTFMVGSEGGRVFKCYMDMNDAALKEFAKSAAANERVELRCPIKDADYSQHAGAVYGLECSPFHRDLMLTCGYDGCVHLYHSLKNQHLMEVVPSAGPLYQVAWSPIRPLVFAACGHDGRVHFYDLGRVKGLVSPVLTMDASPEGKPTYSIAFNKKKPEMFATAGASGIQIWRLPANLCELRKGEEGTIRRLAAADDFEAVLRGLKR